jgi:hypothetical protein
VDGSRYMFKSTWVIAREKRAIQYTQAVDGTSAVRQKSAAAY